MMRLSLLFPIGSTLTLLIVGCGSSETMSVNLDDDQLGPTGLGPTIPTTETSGSGSSTVCNVGTKCTERETGTPLTTVYFKRGFDSRGRPTTVECTYTYQTTTTCVGKYQKNGTKCECSIADRSKDCSAETVVLDDSCTGA